MWRKILLFSIAITLGMLIAHFQNVNDSLVVKYPSKVSKTLYLDRAFSEDEKIIIIMAAMEWNQVTNHIVNYDVRMLPDREINPTKSIIIVKTTEDYPEIVSLDLFNKFSTLGFYNKDLYIPSIWLVADRIDARYYKAVVLHELGHSLGLNHNKELEGVGTLMHPNIELGSDHITNEDLDNFCKLYKCKLQD